MLCLSVKSASEGGETIIFKTAHGDITLIIADIEGSRIRLGIKAPIDVQILRVKQILKPVHEELAQ